MGGFGGVFIRFRGRLEVGDLNVGKKVADGNKRFPVIWGE